VNASSDARYTVGCFHRADKGDVQERGGAIDDDLDIGLESVPVGTVARVARRINNSRFRRGLRSGHFFALCRIRWHGRLYLLYQHCTRDTDWVRKAQPQLNGVGGMIGAESLLLSRRYHREGPDVLRRTARGWAATVRTFCNLVLLTECCSLLESLYR